MDGTDARWLGIELARAGVRLQSKTFGENETAYTVSAPWPLEIFTWYEGGELRSRPLFQKSWDRKGWPGAEMLAALGWEVSDEEIAYLILESLVTEAELLDGLPQPAPAAKPVLDRFGLLEFD